MNPTSFFALPPGAELREVPVDDVTLAVVFSPVEQSRGVVHFVHGFTGSKEDAWPLIEPLNAQGFTVIAHDHRGQFQSAHAPSHTYALDTLAADIAAIHRYFGFDVVHIIGHSFGGLVAQQFAVDNKPASLTLLCTGPAALTERIGKFSYTQDFLRNKSAKDARRQWQETRDPQLNIGFSDSSDDLYATRWDASDMNSVIAHLGILASASDVTARIAEKKIPTQVVYGEFDDAWPITQQLELATKLNGSVVVISGSGHCPNEDNPEVLATVMDHFIKSM